ncbi:MAG: hypothetical protein KDC02_25490 [Flavobacteriales bacterium]|nr:hypothetical protein [Flavobacteriales bacterium]
MERSELLLFLRQLVSGVIGSLLLFCLLAWCAHTWPSIAVGLGYPKTWIKVLERVQAADRGTASDTLFLGDSVAGQLMPFDHDHILTSNGSVYVAGNHLLVQKALDRSPALRTVVYMTVPHVLGHKFERKRTWGNFVKPFISSEMLPLMDSSITTVLDEHPWASTLRFLPAKFLPISDVDLENGVDRPLDELSPFAIHWLTSLHELCMAHDLDLVLVSPPVGEYLRAKTNDWERMRRQVAGSQLEPLIKEYLNSVRYHPDSCLVDRTHWKKAYVEQNRDRMVHEMLAPLRPN